MPSDLTAVTFHNAVTEEYRRAVEHRGDVREGINRQDAFAFAYEAIAARVHAGEISIPMEDAIHAALLSADGRDGAAADSILSKLARGEVGLTIWPDPMLNVVVTLGKGRRKPWKRVTADDLVDMIDLRHNNTVSARRAERRFTRDVEAVYGQLVDAGSVEQMVAAARATAAA